MRAPTAPRAWKSRRETRADEPALIRRLAEGGVDDRLGGRIGGDLGGGGACARNAAGGGRDGHGLARRQRRRRGLDLRAEMRQGVDRDAAGVELEMQMRPGRQAGIARKRDDVALLDFGARLDRGGNFREVRIGRLESGVLDANVIAESGDRCRRFPLSRPPPRAPANRPPPRSRFPRAAAECAGSDGIACRTATSPARP